MKRVILVAILLIAVAVVGAAKGQYEYIQRTGVGDEYFDKTTAATTTAGSITTMSARVLIRMSDAARIKALEKFKIQASTIVYDVVYKIENFNNERNELSKKIIKAIFYDASGNVVLEQDMGGKWVARPLDSPDLLTATAILGYCKNKK